MSGYEHEFTNIPQPEVISVRGKGVHFDKYYGKLIRSQPGHPIWADVALQRSIGGPFTHDGDSATACAEVDRLLKGK